MAAPNPDDGVQLLGAVRVSAGGSVVGGAGEDAPAAPAAPQSFAPDLEEVDLTNERLPALPDVRGCPRLHTLVLRVNNIRELPAELLRLPALTHLDLYSNQIQRAEGLEGLASLTYLDLSFNETREIRGLDALGELRELYLIANKIGAVPEGALAGLGKLRLLELGSNRLRAAENLECLAGSLEELYLGRNKITSTDGLAALTGLRKLSMQANRLVSIGAGLRPLARLEELYLSQNGIEQVEGLETLTQLRVLDLGHNRLRRLAGLEALTELRDLWLSHNYLESLDDLACVAGATALETLYLEANPLQRDADYRDRVLAVFPRLKQLDADVLVEDEDEDMA